MTERERVASILGRQPTDAEGGVFDAMWSEHCSYKSSRHLLQSLPTEGAHILQGPGENAGVVDFGDGIAVAFKMESHNHPSAVEPFQGAATGVGGILRDIFAMGARPVAILDALFFGMPGDPHGDRLMREVVRGVAGYGNCIGVPTVGGMICHAPCYASNPLVNVMAAGVMDARDLRRAGAGTPGASVVYYGSPTGRDGVHGATFASAELDAQSGERRGAIQVADPFTGKRVMEATLALVRAGLVQAVQDMGAAGLTCSSAEMAARGGTGIVLSLDRVPRRGADLAAYEMLLAETQERMLCAVAPGDIDAARRIIEHWGVGCHVVGEITADGMYRVDHGGRRVVDVPVRALADEAPSYRRASRSPALATEPFRPGAWTAEADPSRWLRELLAHPTIAPKDWAFSQYDSTIRTDTLVGPGPSDAAMLRVEGTRRVLAMACGCDPLKGTVDPFAGAQRAVAEAALNIACSGARPLAITNCLNFGNPEKPESFWQFERAVAGLGDMASRLGTPVTGGNVSLYNETPGSAAWPTPTVAMIGACESLAHIVPPGWRAAGDRVYILGALPATLDASWLAWMKEGVATPRRARPGAMDGVPALVALLVELAWRRLLASAHDASEGGIAVAAAECCMFSRGLGASLDLPPSAEALFGEDVPVALVSASPVNAAALERAASVHGVPCREAGVVTATGRLEAGDMRWEGR